MLQATSRLRERGCDGRLAGIEVQQLFCSQSAAIPEHQLKELNIKIDSALQVSFPELAQRYLRDRDKGGSYSCDIEPTGKSNMIVAGLTCFKNYRNFKFLFSLDFVIL